MLESKKKNTGFTYTDFEKHITMVIIGEADSASEFFNTFVHEIGHVSTHIAEFYGIDTNSEEIQYLSGEIALQMFEKAKELMCDHCRLLLTKR